MEQKQEGAVYSVRDLCRLTGVTRKTLFYYDHKGLLKPTERKGPQSSKYYSSCDLFRLRKILTWKRAGLELQVISVLLEQEDSIPVELLEQRLSQLKETQRQLVHSIRLLEQLIQQEQQVHP
ncbi:MAG: MerR family transcriptional regulator [Solobacterium sp.]|nr:MerR family transcriptional regulator [Solobacterium sp.]